jgi:hypothetical protein
VPICAQFLWAYVWAGRKFNQAGIEKSLGSSPGGGSHSVPYDGPLPISVMPTEATKGLLRSRSA